MVFIVILCSLQVAYFYQLYPRSKRSSNFVKAYIIGVESWDAYAITFSSFFSTVLFNDTSEYWGISSLEKVESHISHIRKNVLANITEALDYDLGNFSQSYRDIMSKVSIPTWLTTREILARWSTILRIQLESATCFTTVYLTRISSILCQACQRASRRWQMTGNSAAAHGMKLAV